MVAIGAGCAAPGRTGAPEDAADASEGSAEVDDLLVVDCLLPGQVRRLGGMTYITPRRPTRTTARDCSIRGGEYVAYDRADYRSALNVWLARAEEGDAEAQTYVGEIFEKGLGREPDYVSAASWYRRAAEQGYTRAQINLGFMYESGLGVERNIATALNWYRQASGLSGDDLVFESDMELAIGELREELEGKVASADRQAEVLQTQLQRLERERTALQERLDAAQEDAERQEVARDEDESQRRMREELATELGDARDQIATLSLLYTRASAERGELEAELAELPRQRSIEPRLQPTPAVALETQDPRTFRDINFGRYYALIIGNQDYQHLQSLASPMRDALQVKEILETRYGFSTIILANADQRSILNAINDLYEQIGPEDNLLIYYAGHGNISEVDGGQRRRGYWLPVDAEADRFVHWINNSVISDHLDRIRARSILVMADSCYAGALASERSALLLGSGATRLSKEAIEQGLSRRSRIVISSGGIHPVLDTLDGRHSLFAGSLIEVLQSNEEVLRENMLFARVAVNVRRKAQANDVEQTPEMRPIRAAGHEGGDFYFIPVAAGS
ncbi:MAG: caspase family protein [Aquisalimonadaceae bacterium]